MVRTEAAAMSEQGAPTEKHSIMYHAAADYAARKHLDWERLSYDIEETTSEHWRRRFWRLWFRVRWVEHVLGEKHWIEMGGEHFGLLTLDGAHDPLLVSRVADRLIVGWENLGLILWATDWGLDIDEIIEILKKININHILVNEERIDRYWERLIN
jgi:hypothetical protein